MIADHPPDLGPISWMDCTMDGERDGMEKMLW